MISQKIETKTNFNKKNWKIEKKNIQQDGTNIFMNKRNKQNKGTK